MEVAGGWLAGMEVAGEIMELRSLLL